MACRAYTQTNQRHLTSDNSIFGHTPKNSNSSHNGITPKNTSVLGRHSNASHQRSTIFKLPDYTAALPHLPRGSAHPQPRVMVKLHHFYLEICTAAECATVHIRKYKPNPIHFNNIYHSVPRESAYPQRRVRFKLRHFLSPICTAALYVTVHIRKYKPNPIHFNNI